jgi:rod shape-determining protein MreC
MALDVRIRAGWLFLAVVVGHIVLISAQVNTQRGMPLFEAVTFGIFSEAQRGVAAVISGVREGWEHYFALQRIREDNTRLRAERARLQVALQQERAAARQARLLEDLLELRTQVDLETVAASVIATAPSPESRTVTIDKGMRDGVRSDMAVIAPSGVVGRVITPGARAANVQLLIDRNAGAGAVVERSRAQGVVVGTGTDRLRLEYVAPTADIEVGDWVVTSGIEGIYPDALREGSYPRGFVIGQIESIQRSAGQYSAILVRPAVDFGTLETVLVVRSPASDAAVGAP